MKTQAFRLTPVDTWFFRDGRPFEMGAIQNDAESLFPPPTRTLVGALRLALARGQGYTPGREKWGKAIAEVLGDGQHALGKLCFSGPYLMLGEDVLYPFPMHVVGEWYEKRDAKKFRATRLLAPSENEVLTDLGRVRLPEPKTPGVGLQSGAGLFLPRAGYDKVLAGGLPDETDIVLPETLYAYEDRIGLARDPGKRTALQGHLYRTRHIRLTRNVGVCMSVKGLPPGWAEACSSLLTLGGEHRMADVEPMELAEPLSLPLNAIQQSGRMTITLLTPLMLAEKTMLQKGGRFADWDGVTVESACLGKPIMLGGWDGDKRESLPLQPYLPPGSTWFCNVNEDAKDTLGQRYRACVGAEGAWGFGAVALGTW